MITINRRGALLGAATVVGARLAGSISVRADTGRTALDHVLQQAVESGGLSGVVGVAATDKGSIYEGAFGRRGPSLESATMTSDSVFWIASMTKAVTTTAAMQQVEQGKLSLDEPLSAVLPELASVQVLEGFDHDGKPILRPARRPITLRLLLTHTAGFTYDFWDNNEAQYEKATGLPSIGTCRLEALRAPLAFDPGERWEYGINIDWAGRAVEKVSGQTLGAYFQEHLFGPLGMTSTGFKLTGSQRARLVAMGSRQPDGSLKAIDFEMPQEPEFEMGGGGLYSTAGDYMRFCQLFLHAGCAEGGAQLLRPETVAQMGRNQIGDINVVMLKSVDAASTGDAEFFPGMVKKWGLGFMINTEDAPTGRSAGSLAWAGLANTYFWIDPRQKVAGVIMMQLLPFVDGSAMQAFSRFETATYDAVRTG